MHMAYFFNCSNKSRVLIVIYEGLCGPCPGGPPARGTGGSGGPGIQPWILRGPGVQSRRRRRPGIQSRWWRRSRVQSRRWRWPGVQSRCGWWPRVQSWWPALPTPRPKPAGLQPWHQLPPPRPESTRIQSWKPKFPPPGPQSAPWWPKHPAVGPNPTRWWFWNVQPQRPALGPNSTKGPARPMRDGGRVLRDGSARLLRGGSTVLHLLHAGVWERWCSRLQQTAAQPLPWGNCTWLPSSQESRKFGKKNNPIQLSLTSCF